MASTFSDLLQVVKRDILGDDLAEDVFSDANDLYPMLYYSASEIASTLGFPQEDAVIPVAPGESSLPLPAGLAAVRVDQVRVGAFDLRAESPAGLLRKSQYLSGHPAVYHFDPRVNEAVEFAPPWGDLSGVARVRFTKFLNPESMLPESEPWEGRLQSWYWVIPLLAGEKAFRAQGDEERAQSYFNRFTMALMQMASFLGLPPSEVGPNLLARMDAASQMPKAHFPAQARGGN